MIYKLIQTAPYSWKLYYKKHWYNKWKPFIKYTNNGYSTYTINSFHTYIDAIKNIPGKIIKITTM